MPKNARSTIDTLNLQDRVGKHMKAGYYESEQDVIESAFEALEREERAREDEWRRKIKEAYDDPRPSIPAEEVFARLIDRHKARMRRDGIDP